MTTSPILRPAWWLQLIALSGVALFALAVLATPPDNITRRSTETNPAITETSDNAETVAFGRWKGDEVCLDLFANGDFELSVFRKEGAKVVVLGSAKQTTSKKNETTLELSVSKIWSARWVSRCRRDHQTGDWINAQRALGVEFRPEQKMSLVLRKLRGGRVELCAKTCAALTIDAPLLGGDWRRTPPKDTVEPVKPGDLTRLDISIGRGGNIGFAKTEDTSLWSNIYGDATVKHVEADTFHLTFKRNRDSNDLKGPTTILGVEIPLGVFVHFQLRRLPNQRLEICGAEGQCITLERAFDAYSHELR